MIYSVFGGGRVYFCGKGTLSGVAAVIDKDLAAELLAELVDADLLLILTEVENAAINYGTEEQRNLYKTSVDDMKKYIAEGHFGSGSMLPKALSAVKFAESGVNRNAVITSLENALRAVEGKAGTIVFSPI